MHLPKFPTLLRFMIALGLSSFATHLFFDLISVKMSSSILSDHFNWQILTIQIVIRLIFLFAIYFCLGKIAYFQKNQPN